MERNYDFLYKIIIISDAGVDKSNLVTQFAQKQFIEEIKPIIGVEFYTRSINLENDTVAKIQLWDTVSRERYRAITSAYYIGATDALVVYDITKYKTFENIKKIVIGSL